MDRQDEMLPYGVHNDVTDRISELVEHLRASGYGGARVRALVITNLQQAALWASLMIPNTVEPNGKLEVGP